jgi:hypothetical protein
MQNPVAFEVEYREHVRQMAWVNDNDWLIEPPAERHPARAAVAKALVALARALTPATERETRVA